MSNKNAKKMILSRLEQHFGNINFPNIEFYSHHLCHAASCFYPGTQPCQASAGCRRIRPAADPGDPGKSQDSILPQWKIQVKT